MVTAPLLTSDGLEQLVYIFLYQLHIYGQRLPGVIALLHFMPREHCFHSFSEPGLALYKKLVKIGPERKGVNVAKNIRARLEYDDNRLMTAAYATALGMWESEGYWISLSLNMGSEARKGQQLLIESLMGRSNIEARLIEDGVRIHGNKLERKHATSLESFLDPYLRPCWYGHVLQYDGVWFGG